MALYVQGNHVLSSSSSSCFLIVFFCPGSESLGFGVTADLVVTKGVDFGGRKRLPVKLEGGVGGDIAIRTFVLLTRGWSYLKEESASCNHCKVGVRKCGVSVSRDCGEGVGVTTVGVVQGGVSWVVGLFN